MLQAIGTFSLPYTVEGGPWVSRSAPYQGSPEQGHAFEKNECLVVSRIRKTDGEHRTTYHKVKVYGDNTSSSTGTTKVVTTDFATRTYGGRQYLYNVTKGADTVLEWVKAIGIFIGNIVHNIFIKCIKVLAIKFLSACGVKFKAEVIEKANRMWDSGTPWKALVGLVVQIVLNILSIVSLGLFTTELNRLSGFVEMKILGDEGSESTNRKRLFEKEYLAPCQQPLGVITQGKEISQEALTVSRATGGKPIHIFPRISSNLRRSLVPMILGSPSPKNLPLSCVNF